MDEGGWEAGSGCCAAGLSLVQPSLASPLSSHAIFPIHPKLSRSGSACVR